MLIKLTTAVKEIDKATSPLANLVYIFDVTPPGAAAIIITPKANSAGVFNNLIKVNATMGSKINWQIKPTRKSLGFFITLVKSLIVKLVPRPTLLKLNLMELTLLQFPLLKLISSNWVYQVNDFIFQLTKINQ